MKKSMIFLAVMLLSVYNGFAQPGKTVQNPTQIDEKFRQPDKPALQTLPALPEDDHSELACGFSHDYLKMMNTEEHRATYMQKFKNARNSFSKAAPPPGAVMNCGRFELFFEDVNSSLGYGFDDPADGAAFRQCVCDVANYIQTVFEVPPGDGTPIQIYVAQSWHPSFYTVGLTGSTIAVGGPINSNPAFLSGASGFYGGNAFDHYISGTDPDPANIDGSIRVNFGAALRLCNKPRNCAEYDFYSVILHEFSHALGWFSNVQEAPLQSVYFPNQYSVYDRNFLYYGDVKTGSPALIKIVNNSGPVISSGLPSNPLTTRKLWVYGQQENHASLNQNLASFSHNAYFMGSGPPNTSSHLADFQSSFPDHEMFAPGFSQDYVMGPMFDRNQLKQNWTVQEMRMLNTMGFQFQPAYIAANPFLTGNRQPYSTRKHYDEMWSYAPPMFLAEIDDNTYTVRDTVITNCDSISFNLTTFPGMFDADGDPIRVYPGSLYNIRGTSKNGINHNCLTVTSTGSGDVIKYKPRANFIGRAQFGFNLYDGKEKGDFIVITIDVTSCMPCATNMVVNGNFEEAMEVKTMSNDIPENTLMQYYKNQKYPLAVPVVLVDGMVYNSYNPLYTRDAGGCTLNEGAFYSYSFAPSPGGVPANSAIPATDRFMLAQEGSIYFRLCSTPVNCSRYILELDVFAAANMNNISFGFTNNPVPAGSAPVIISPTPVSITAGAGWQHITIPMTYCSSSPSYFLVMQYTSYNGNYVFIDNLDVHPDLSPPPPPFSVSVTPSSQTVCQGTAATLTAVPSNPRCNMTYTWMPGSLTTGTVNVSPVANTTYTLTASDGCTTASPVTATVNVSPGPTISASASPSLVCNLNPGSVITATGSSLSYVWSPGGATTPSISVAPGVTTPYTVTGTASNGCTATASTTLTYYNCTPCTSCTPISGTISTGSYSGTAYCMSGNITITGNVTISGSEFQISPGMSITITSSGNLTITNSHFFSCTNMWQGITVQNGGRLTITGSLIEDAVIAVDVSNNTQTTTVLTLSTTTFNKNYVSVNINNYSQSIPTYPFFISNCVFTSRFIPFTPNSLVFPSSAVTGAIAANPNAPLSNARIDNVTYLQTGTFAQLKAPYAGTKPLIGIKLNNVGVTLGAGTVTPTYYGFQLGGASTGNIIDNHYTCVELANSNFTSIGNIYQNTVTYGQNNAQGGFGIYANATSTSNNCLKVIPSSPGNNRNYFVDCSSAIYSQNYFEHQINECDFRSTQKVTAPSVLTNNAGKIGVYVTTNRYWNCYMSYNNFYNIENGINVTTAIGPLSIPGVPGGTQQYAGSIYLTNNTIRPHLPSYTVTNQFVSNAIVLNNNQSGTPYYANGTPMIRVEYSQITDAYRGISMQAWDKEDLYCRWNTISLAGDPYNGSGNPRQFGIYAGVCVPAGLSGNYIISNSITGFGFSNTDAHGILLFRNSNLNVWCNITTNIYNGIVIDSKNTWMVFQRNEMNTNMNGFVLRNVGVIGTQGTVSQPQDNKWTGTWPAGQFKTSVQSGSTATTSVFYIRGTAPSIYNPNGSAYVQPPGIVGVDDYSLPGMTLRPSVNPPQPQVCSMVGKTFSSVGDELSGNGNTFDASLFPNPASGHFSILTNGLLEGEIEVVIFDVAGKEIYRGDHQLLQGQTDVTINASTGVYFCKISNKQGDETITKKLVIQK
jgi:hypothetical protein